MTELLTHSRMICAKTCLRRHFYAYEVGIRKIEDSKPLRIGSMVHLGLDWLAQRGLASAVDAVENAYATMPWPISEEYIRDLEYERVIVLELLAAYAEYWQEDDAEILMSENAFRIPLMNPDTRGISQTWQRAGKIDKLIRRDGRVLLREHKTCSEDISPDFDYWKRLRIDQQISHYVIACQDLGYDVSSVEYDVIQKPSISPRKVDLCDPDGFSIVLDANGERVYKKDGTPRKTGDLSKGYTLQTRPETPGEFALRLRDDIRFRPEFYFARREIPRLWDDLNEYREEVWDIGRTLADCRRHGRWYRNTSACLRPYKCPYFDICTSGQQVDANNIPQGFEIVTNVNQELEEV